MIIPFREHLDGKEPRYLAVIKIAAELGFEVWEVAPLLEESDYAREPDFHWNRSGHRKVAYFLKEQIAAEFADR